MIDPMLLFPFLQNKLVAVTMLKQLLLAVSPCCSEHDWLSRKLADDNCENVSEWVCCCRVKYELILKCYVHTTWLFILYSKMKVS